MDDRDRWQERELGNPVLSAQLDDDDYDDMYVWIYKDIYD